MKKKVLQGSLDIKRLFPDIPAISDVSHDSPDVSYEVPDLLDQVYCWWMEHPESQKTHICIRKAIGTSIVISLSSEKSISITVTLKLKDEELVDISSSIGLSKDIVSYHLGQMEPIKETIITLEFPVINQPITNLNNNNLLVISFPMKKNNSLIFE